MLRVRYARGLGKDAEDAEDLVAEDFDVAFAASPTASAVSVVSATSFLFVAAGSAEVALGWVALISRRGRALEALRAARRARRAPKGTRLFLFRASGKSPNTPHARRVSDRDSTRDARTSARSDELAARSWERRAGVGSVSDGVAMRAAGIARLTRGTRRRRASRASAVEGASRVSRARGRWRKGDEKTSVHEALMIMIVACVTTPRAAYRPPRTTRGARSRESGGFSGEPARARRARVEPAPRETRATVVLDPPEK